MTLIELLARLRQEGVEPRLLGRRLEWLGSRDRLPEPLRTELLAREAEVRAFLSGMADEPVAVPPLVPHAACTGPLSFAQERLWFIDQLVADRSLYNVALDYRVLGPVDVGALSHALGGLVARHPALRTTYTADSGVPRQVVGPPFEVAVERVAIPENADDPEALALAQAVRTHSAPLDLARGPLLRAVLISLSPTDHVLALTIHHIATDGWSSPIIERELSELYAACLAGRPEPALPPCPVQYLDYALWQREWLKGEALERQLLYWRTRLAGVPELELPADRPRPRRPTGAGDHVRFTLPDAVVASLRAFCRGRRVTPFMTLVSAIATLLHRLTGQELVALGLPVSNRTRPEIEGLVGFFVNSLVLVADFRDEPSFAELVASVRESMLEALAFQELPFEKLVEALRPARDLARNPIFPVMFGHNYTPPCGLRLPGAEARPLNLDRRIAKFDLLIETQEHGDVMSGAAQFSVELFDRATVERLVAHFTTLLAAAVLSPETRVDRLPLQDEHERRRTVEVFNRTASPYPRERSIADLFRAQAARSPSAVAIEHGERRVTYAELDAWSERLAAGLVARGVGTGQLVGLALPRSAAAIAVTLAALKAGAAYLPLAAEEPPARLARILAETAPVLVVAGDEMAAALAGAGAAAVPWTGLDERRAPIPAAPPPSAGEDPGSRVAYVMYTSGSTGVPKGIAIPHRAIARLVLAPGYVTITPGDRIAHLSNLAFDAATFEIWGALLNGARLVVFDREEVLDPDALTRRLAERSVTVAFLTTALFNELALSHPAALATLDTLLFGGEAAAPDRVRRVLAAGPPARLVHVYGPTESTTFATAYEVRAVSEDASTIPIGAPIARTTCFVLDRHGEPVPVGVPGELFLGGDGLALGYVGGPRELAARFVPDPFAAAPGARLYRTGDRARWRPDGNLEFLGRVDDQIKLRGFRIEPAEIEETLRRHPGVAEAVVVPRRREPTGLQLVAFVVGVDGASPTLAELRAFAREQLPDYMVPAGLALLPALPRTFGGKIDRQALSVMEIEQDVGEAPRTPLERTVAGVFGELLGASRVGLDDDFFALGGHSLLAVRAVAEVNSRLRAAVPLRQFFLAPTVRAVAAAVLAARLASLPADERARLMAAVADPDPSPGR